MSWVQQYLAFMNKKQRQSGEGKEVQVQNIALMIPDAVLRKAMKNNIQHTLRDLMNI